MRTKFTFLLLLVLVFSTKLFSQKKFELSDVSKFTGISDPQISPDAKSVIVVVSRPDYQQNRYNSELVLIDIATGKQRILT